MNFPTNALRRCVETRLLPKVLGASSIPLRMLLSMDALRSTSPAHIIFAIRRVMFFSIVPLLCFSNRQPHGHWPSTRHLLPCCSTRIRARLAGMQRLRSYTEQQFYRRSCGWAITRVCRGVVSTRCGWCYANDVSTPARSPQQQQLE